MTVIDLKTQKPCTLGDEPLVFALGNFDGVHIGHQKVLKRAKAESERLSAKSVAWCLSSEYTVNSGELLTDNEEKIRYLGTLGLDYAVFESFECVRDMSDTGFVHGYLNGLNCVSALCGFNFRFGKGAAADSERLIGLCHECGMEAFSESAVLYDGEPVSSTRIRNLLKEGEVKKASVLLSRPYTLSGIVSKGRGIGRKFGFPTVNLNFDHGKLVPERGVYYTVVEVDGVKYPSVSNVGSRPTVSGHTVRLETHMIGFEGDLYEKNISVAFLEYRRNEIRFSSENDLMAAIGQDKIAAEKYFKNR